MKALIIIISIWLVPWAAAGQTASPVVSFYNVDENADVELSPGEEKTAQAPLDITMKANVDLEGKDYTYALEWRVYDSDKGEQEVILTRFAEESTYTLTSSGGYGIKLYVTFVDANNDTLEYVSQQMKIVISESELSCPDGFSPNNDQKNDEFKIKHKSIVKLQGYVVNRWGKKLHEFTLQNVDDGWDGRYGGDYVPDGAYLLYIDALGSDGVHYKIRKAINVLKGKNEGEGTTTGTP